MGVSGRIARFFASSQMTPLLALVALLMGIFATLVTPREEEPQIDVTMADVFIAFPGASVQDVENLVATPAEQVLSRMSGVEHVYSVSRPGMAVVTVQFEVGVKYNDAVVRLYDTVHSNRDWLSPDLGVLEPVVKPRGIDDVPIVSLTFWSTDPERSAFDLQQVARAAEVDFKRIKGTRDVSTLGGPDHVLRVSMDSERMNAFSVTPQDIAATLRAGNARQSSGSLVAENRQVLVETGSYLESAADVRQLVVAVRGTGSERKPVFIGDVARVEEGPDQPRQYVWFGNRDGEFPAVTVQVSKKPGVNAADVASAVIARAESLKGTLIPAGVEVTTTRNYGQTATDKAQKLIGKLVFATAFVVLLVFFALGKREALIVGVAVSLTLAATLFASWAWGFTLNRVSLFALIFSIGILVDDAIVVVENIHRWQALQPGKPLLEIIPLAVDEVGGPTILATFTVIAALLPMAFVTGLMGPYMSPIPINSSLGMFISLAVAFVVTPWLAARLLAKAPQTAHSAAGAAPHAASESPRPSRLERLFRRLLTPFLDARKGRVARRWLLLVIMLLIAGSLFLAAVQLVVLKMLPFDNKSEFQVVLDMPVGTPLEETARVLHELGAEIAKVPEVSNYQAYAGTASPINFNGLVRQYYLRAAPELGDLQVNLVDHQQRARKSHEIAISVRDAIEAIGKRAGGNAKVVEVPPGPPVLSPIVAEVYGPDYRGQRAVAREVRKVLEATPDLVAIDDSVNAGGQRSVLHVLQNKAALLGVAQSDIVDVIRMGLAGDDVTPVHNTGSKYEIPVRLTLPSRAAEHARRAAQAARPLARRAAGAGFRTCRGARAGARAGDLPQEPAAGGVCRRRHGRQARFAALRHVRGAQRDRRARAGGGRTRGRHAGRVVHQAAKCAGRLVQHQMGRRVAGDLRDVSRHGHRLRRRPDPHLPARRRALQELSRAADHHGANPADHHRRHAGARLARQPVHGDLDDRHDCPGRDHRPQLDPAGRLHSSASRCEGMELREAIVQSASVRAKPIALTGLAAMLGAMFILDDPIFNGLAISLIFGIFVSTLLTLVVIPVLYYAAFRKENQT
jgi:multidrug efflux pump subunit AcrB